MEELNKLLNKYQENLQKAQENLKNCTNSFPYFSFGNDMLIHFNMELLNFLENILNKLTLSENELQDIKNAFSYYKLNQDIDFSKLLIRDEKYYKFLDTLDKLYIKVLKYKETLELNYQREIENCNAIIKPLDVIKGLFQSSSEIDINNLKNLVSKLNLSDDFKLDILSYAINHNLALYELKTELEPESLEENLEIELDIAMNDKTLDSYLRKINYLLTNLSSKENKSEKDYLNQAKLVEFQERCKTLSEEYKTIMSMNLNSSPEEKIILEITKEEMELEFKKIVFQINAIENESLSVEDLEEIEEVEESDLERNLIFLNSSLKDIDYFTSDACQINIIKKLYSMFNHLKKDKDLNKIIEPCISNYSLQFPIYEYRGKTTGKGAPTIFYQLVNNQVIILLMAIRGKHDHFWFKNTIESRVNANFETEYVKLINALNLASSSPTKPSIYDNNLTNLEYLNNLLLKYQEREIEFFEKFHLECYNPNKKMR